MKNPNSERPLAVALLCFATALLLSACGGGGSSAPAPTPITTYTISGHVQGAASATVNLTGAKSAVATTDASGNFSFSGLANGAYSITPTQSGMVFAPVVTTATVNSANVTLADFVSSAAADALPDATVTAIAAAPESPLSLSAMLNPDGSNVADYLVSRGITLPTAPSQLMSVRQRKFTTAVSSATGAPTLPPANSPAQRKQDVIDVMVGVATFLACGRATPPCTTWDFPADASSPATYPAQKGLAYVYGGKTPNVRTLPADGCPQYLYGVDASGLIDVLASSVGMTVVPAAAADQAKPGNWTIPADWGLRLVSVTDTSQQYLGDIVVWSDHIGIVTTAPGVVNVISSTGKAGQCTANANPPSGPRSLSIANLGLGQPTALLRLQPIATLSTASVAVSANPPSLFAGGGTVQFSATVSALLGAPSTSAAPTGTVTFVDQSGTALCSSVALKSATAPCAAAISSVPDTVTAKYSGDANYAAGTATVTVTAYGTFATNTTLVADPTGVPPIGGSVSFTATVTSSNAPANAATPTGTVKFVDDAGSILCAGVPIAAGVAKCNADLSSAPKTVTATYSGDVTYLPSTNVTTVAAQPYGTATALTANPSSLPSGGGSVTLTAKVTSTNASAAISPTGAVTFFDQSGATLCSAVVLTGGSAVCPTTIAAAPDTVRADYHSGDTNFVDSSDSVTITGFQAYDTVTTLVANPSSIPSSGAIVAFTATVTSPTSPTGGPSLDGTVTFSNQAGAILCQSVPLNLGSASCSSPIAAVPNTVTASYTPGTTYYSSSSGSTTVTAIAPPTVILTAYPESVLSGGVSTISWTSANAATCTAAGGWTASNAISGDLVTGPLTADTTFTMTCADANGTQSAPATVQVSVATNLPTVYLTAAPRVVASGGNTVISWVSSNATSCAASGGWTSSTAVDDSVTVGPVNSTTRYTITCTGATGSVTTSTLVQVSDAPGVCIPPTGATTCAVTLYSIPDLITHSGFVAPVPGTITTVQTNNGVTTTTVNNLNPLGVTIYDNVNGPPLNAPICNYSPTTGCPALNYHTFQLCAVDGKYTPVSYNSVVSDQVPANTGCTGSPNVNNIITGYTLTADGILTGTDTSTASENLTCQVPYISGPGSYTATASLQNAKNDPISMNLKDGSGHASVSETRQSQSTNSLDPSQNQTSTTSVTGTQSWPAESVSPPQFPNTGITASTTYVPAGQALPQSCTVGTP